MLTRASFYAEVADAYEHLYDLVKLRTHALADALVPDEALGRKDRAWRLHHLLISAISELDPGPQAPAFSREWRRHRIMVLRYIDGLDPLTAAEQVAISRRTYYREHEAALQAIAQVLWNSYLDTRPAEVTPEEPASLENLALPDRMDLLRGEAARMARSSHNSTLSDVVNGAMQLLGELARANEIDIVADLPANLPSVAIDPNILRQILLGTLGFLIAHPAGNTIHVRATHEQGQVELLLLVAGSQSGHETMRTNKEPGAMGRGAEFAADLDEFSELAALQGARLELREDAGVVAGFGLYLPDAPPRTILVVDDNEDVLQLFERYLGAHNYRVVTTRSSTQGIALASELQPFAITLDLMMPDRDGWDVLQTLTNQPKTQHIPVIVCSVLSARELALSLGAAAFLKKPIEEHTLLATLSALGTS
ncbi:MAG: response regulator [Anaerolineae bacterium]